MKIKIALLQFNITLGDVAANERKVEAMAKEAMASGVDIIALPELWNTGYDFEHLSQLGQKEKDSSMSLLKHLAAQHKVNILGGSLVERRENNIYNMSPLINRKGIIEEKYRKAHLFPLIKEEQYFSAGDRWGLAEIDGVTLGMMLCYDLRFPELCRNLVLRGAKIVFVPAEWPQARLNHWRLLLQSRAIENQIFVLAINAVGSDGAINYGGHSLVVDPAGNILAEGDEKEGIIKAELDLDLVTEARKKIPALAGRLNILDEIDNNYF